MRAGGDDDVAALQEGPGQEALRELQRGEEGVDGAGAGEAGAVRVAGWLKEGRKVANAVDFVEAVEEEQDSEKETNNNGIDKPRENYLTFRPRPFLSVRQSARPPPRSPALPPPSCPRQASSSPPPARRS